MKTHLLKFALIVCMCIPLSVNAGDANNSPKADNSANNVADQYGTKLTPTDQSRGTDADVEITRMARRKLVRDNSLSMNAKNIKIITLKNIVTLRGPVASEAERVKVAELVSSVAPSVKVVNNLEVIR